MKPHKTAITKDQPGRRRSKWGAPIPVICVNGAPLSLAEAARRERGEREELTLVPDEPAERRRSDGI
jgi:hypothetical protein